MNNEYLTPVNLRREIYDSLNIHTDTEIINIYNHSKIYKIVSPSTDKIYIGSTTQTLAQRLGKHLSNYKYYTINNKGYITSYEIIKLGDYSIQLIEQCNFNNKEQLRQREGYYIKLHRDICVNKYIPLRTDSEYRNDNKEKLKLCKKKHYINNKEHITEYNKQLRITNKDSIAEQKKQYYIDNKEHLTEYIKQYRVNNKQVLTEKHKQTIQCDCGIISTKRHLSRHQQTPKHFTNINTNINMIYLNELTTL
jgi:GIY-YIG catalytic domain